MRKNNLDRKRSEPVEGRGVSPDWKNGSKAGEAKDKSRTDGCPRPPREKLVYPHSWLRKPCPSSADLGA